MKKLSILTFLFISISSFAQSPWTKAKGDLFTQFSFTTISDYNEIFGDPEYNTEREITDQTYQIYAEYGLSDKTTLLFSLPIKSIETGSLTNNTIGSFTNAGSESGLGNIEFGVKHQFYNNGWVLAGQLSSEFNTSTYDDATGIRTGYDALTFTPLFLAGKSFGKTYFQANIGAQIRTNDYSSNFKFGGEYGGKIFKNFWLIGFVDIVKSFKNGDVNLPANNLATALYVNDQEYGAYGLKGIWQFCDFGLTAGFGGAFFGNNVPQAPAISFGIFNTF